MNIIKWTLVVVAGMISATIIAVAFLVTNAVNVASENCLWSWPIC